MTPKQTIKILDGQLTDCYADIEVKTARIAELEAALRSIQEIPNSDAAQGIMKVLAHCALEANT
jgi:hypothetical protein